MHIVLFCATRRGHLFLEKLAQLAPDAALTVFSFREEAHEPPFMDGIREAALARGGAFHETKNVGGERWREFWATTPVDLMLAVSWRYMIPETVYGRARLGAFVFHDSLLPAYRGFAPTVWAILNGEEHTGVTMFEIAEEVDSGDIVAQQRVPIGADDTIAGVMERVTQAYVGVLETTLPRLLDGTAPRSPQDQTQATYTCRRLPEDNAIDWTQPTQRVYNLIRAVTAPYSGAFTTLNGQPLRVWSARRLADFPPYVGRVPGRIVEVRYGEGSIILTGDGALLLTQVQLEGGEVVRADDILNKTSLTLGR
jgi:methionyl-tRNA formyltransferase